MRLDQLLVERGLFPSRERAKRAVMAGLVLVDGQKVDKAGTAVAGDSSLDLLGGAEPFVSRAGRKLDHALARFAIDVEGAVCLDVGASTGGFTHCLLERGAARIYALDVGYGQLDLRLRRDPRVVVMERTNARYLSADAFDESMAVISIDVSFISLLKVVPALLPHLAAGGLLAALIKPQFEAGREHVHRGGVVRDEEVRRQIVAQRVVEIAALGLEVVGTVEAPIAGARAGNREVLAVFRSPSDASESCDG